MEPAHSSQLREKLITHITQNQNKFYRLAYGYTYNADAALDIVQNAIVKALEHYETLRNPDGINTWFYRILVNESLGYLKKHKKETLYPPEMMTETLESKAAPQADTALYDCIALLPGHFQTVIMLHFYEGLTLKEISEITDTNLNTIKYRLYAGLRQLRRQYKEEIS